MAITIESLLLLLCIIGISRFTIYLYFIMTAIDFYLQIVLMWDLTAMISIRANVQEYTCLIWNNSVQSFVIIAKRYSTKISSSYYVKSFLASFFYIVKLIPFQLFKIGFYSNSLLFLCSNSSQLCLSPSYASFMAWYLFFNI